MCKGNEGNCCKSANVDLLQLRGLVRERNNLYRSLKDLVNAIDKTNVKLPSDEVNKAKLLLKSIK